MGEELKSRCAELLRAMGKTLAQIALYTVRHATVQKSIEENHTQLEKVLAEVGQELTLSLDKDNLLANGSVVMPAAQAPSALTNLFRRFELHGVTFVVGVSAQELKNFYEALTMRPEQFEGKTLQEYLDWREVCQIRPNAAVYAKVEKAQEGPVAVAGAAGGGSGAEPGSVAGRIEQAPLKDAVDLLVQQAVPDPKEAARVRELVMAKVQEDLVRRVDEAVQSLKGENQRLTNQLARTDAVIGSVAEAVVMVDEAGKVIFMNPAAEQLYGKPLAEMAGKPLQDNTRTEDQLLALSKQIGTPSDRALDPAVSAVGADSASRTLRSSTAAVRNEQGAIVGMVTGLPDVAKFRELERMQDEFVAQVTHELRSPLTSITAALSLMRQQFAGRLESDESRMLELANKNADRLALLINDILDFNKIQSGQLRVHPIPADPAKLIKEGSEGLEPWAKQKDVGLERVAAEGLPQVFADPKRVTQIITNLLSNSIKLSPKGSRVVVKAATVPSRKDHVVFSVQDRGPGMTKEEQASLFGKFVQFVAGEKVGGTGLGLSIAKALVSMQKGEIWVESRKGAGTTFYFTLPVLKPEMIGEIAEKKIAPPKAPQPEPSWWQRLLSR